uniref:Uncharacterized protein n=1 Tax=Arundo donax TaxID=35708 RepID=A0A0A9FB44_ARUDO
MPVSSTVPRAGFARSCVIIQIRSTSDAWLGKRGLEPYGSVRFFSVRLLVLKSKLCGVNVNLSS